MIIMTEENVMLGLKCCGAKSFQCEKCPYEHYGMKQCSINLCKDALRVIRTYKEPAEGGEK